MADPAVRAMSRSVDYVLDAVVAGPDVTVKKAPFRNPKKAEPHNNTPRRSSRRTMPGSDNSTGSKAKKAPKRPHWVLMNWSV